MAERLPAAFPATSNDAVAGRRARPGTSAGSQPASQLNPAVVAAMAEIGLDISREFPKPPASDKVQAADVVITMGCGDTCPVCPGKRYLGRDLPDPAGLTLDQVRPIREDIERRVRILPGRADHRRDVAARRLDLFRGRCGAQFWLGRCQ